MCLAFVNGWPFFAPIKASREIQPGPVSREGAKPRSKNERWAAVRCFRWPARIAKPENGPEPLLKSVSVRPPCALCLCGGIVSCSVIIIS